MQVSNLKGLVLKKFLSKNRIEFFQMNLLEFYVVFGGNLEISLYPKLFKNRGFQKLRTPNFIL
jgi:hypothetical protein